jgi:PEP-CTERM motif
MSKMNPKQGQLSRQTLSLFGAVACALGVAGQARADAVLCPSQATPGGFGGTATQVAGPLDGTCGANSAYQLSIPTNVDYGKLQFNAGMAGYPLGLTLGGLAGLSADVNYSNAASDEPFYLLDFTDSSNSLGQGNATDQILFIEFQAAALAGNTLATDVAATLFNAYDNTTGTYLQGGQSHTHTLSDWLAAFPVLGGESLDGIWIGMGLAGGSGSGTTETLTINSLTVNTAAVPEPATLGLVGLALAGLGWAGRKRVRSTPRA